MLEQFAIVRRIRRLLREEVDDKRGDLGSKEHQPLLEQSIKQVSSKELQPVLEQSIKHTSKQQQSRKEQAEQREPGQERRCKQS